MPTRSPTAGWPGSRSRRSGGWRSPARSVTFVAPGTGEVVDTVDVGAPASGLAKVVGIDKLSLYAPWPTGGSRSRLGEAANARPPGPRHHVQDARTGPARLFDDPTGLVTCWADPRRQRRPIYVVEPHGTRSCRRRGSRSRPRPGRSTPTATVRASTGRISSPGGRDARRGRRGEPRIRLATARVIAGALMAGLVFLLVRMLFRRREVAVLAGSSSSSTGCSSSSRGSP